jgi:hypothetical protein
MALARQVGVSPSTVRRWVAIAAIPERVEVAPGVLRFYMPDVYEAIEAMKRRRTEPPAAAGKVGKQALDPNAKAPVATGKEGKQPLVPDTKAPVATGRLSKRAPDANGSKGQK